MLNLLLLQLLGDFLKYWHSHLPGFSELISTGCISMRVTHSNSSKAVDVTQVMSKRNSGIFN